MCMFEYICEEVSRGVNVCACLGERVREFTCNCVCVFWLCRRVVSVCMTVSAWGRDYVCTRVFQSVQKSGIHVFAYICVMDYIFRV